MKCFTGLFIILCLKQVYTIIFVLVFLWKVLLPWYLLASRNCAVEYALLERIHYCLWKSLLGSCIPLHRVNCFSIAVLWIIAPPTSYFQTADASWWFLYGLCTFVHDEIVIALSSHAHKASVTSTVGTCCCSGNYGSCTPYSFLRNHCFIQFLRAM